MYLYCRVQWGSVIVKFHCQPKYVILNGHVCQVFGPGHEQAKHSAQPPSLMISVLDSAMYTKQASSKWISSLTCITHNYDSYRYWASERAQCKHPAWSTLLGNFCPPLTVIAVCQWLSALTKLSSSGLHLTEERLSASFLLKVFQQLLFKDCQILQSVLYSNLPLVLWCVLDTESSVSYSTSSARGHTCHRRCWYCSKCIE